MGYEHHCHHLMGLSAIVGCICCGDITGVIEEDCAAHRKYRREYLRVYLPQPEPRLAVYGEGDIRVDASSDYLLNRLVGYFRPTLPAFGPRFFPFFPAFA